MPIIVSRKSLAYATAVRGAVASGLAVFLEFAIRSAAPLPYAPGCLDLLVSGGLFAVMVVPALAIACMAPQFHRTRQLLTAAPFALLALNLLLAFGQISRVFLGVVIVDVAVATGAVVVALDSRRVVAVGILPCLLFGLALRWLPRGTALADTRGPSVVLIVLDTTTANHLSTYGYGRETSPNLDALARRSIVYRRAISPAPWTIPAHAAIFSGRYPSELGFEPFGFTDSAAGSIASDLRRSGRPAAGITANPILFSQPMLEDGFADLWGARRLTRPFLPRLVDTLLFRRTALPRGDQVTDLALDWVDRVAPRGEPWFLFLNYIDPHAPYDPPRDEVERFAPGIDPASVDAVDYALGTPPESPEKITALRALYDGEIATMDRAVGRLLRGLERRGFDEKNLLLIVTADHGEALGENDFFGHLRGLPDTVLHVPLFISGPGVVPGEVSETVQTVQLRATVRHLLGLPDLPCLAPPLPPWGAAPSLVITEHREVPFFAEALRAHYARDVDPWHGDWFAAERDGVKAIFDGRGHGLSYRLHDDPGELHPLPLDDAAPLVRDYEAWRRTTCAAPGSSG